MADLESRYLRFSCDPEHGCFDVEAANGSSPIRQARLQVSYRQGKARYTALLDSWHTFSPRWGGSRQSLHGPLQVMEINAGVDGVGVGCGLSFALAENSPLMLWKIRVENRSTRPIQLENLVMLQTGQRFGSAGFLRGSAPAFYAHGWQSWNYSAVYSREQRARRTRLGSIQSAMYANPSTPQPSKPGHFSSDFFAVIADRQTRTGWLAGFLSEKQAFGSLEAWLEAEVSLHMWASGDDALLEPEQDFDTDWAVLQPVMLDDPDPLNAYSQAVARENQVDIPDRVPSGWCSWYYYYQNLTAADVRGNLAAVNQLQEQLPLELVQIDDGFERQVGDWFDFAPGFPGGVAPLAEDIQEAGKLPGLWLAPFIVHPASRLAREHPDYLLRDSAGRAVRAGFNWNSFTCALDLTQPAALEYALSSVRTASRDWGFPYLKLDFLYAGGLRGCYHDPHLTRARVLRRGLEALREAAGPDTFLLGCGAPIGPALGLFQAMRIGADVSGDWLPKYLGTHLFFGAEPHMPALRTALQNTLARAFMHRSWWLNDPDCLLVRENTNLTLPEVCSHATVIGLTGGSLLLSDDLSALPSDRLRRATALLPVIGQRPQVIDWFDRELPCHLRLDLSGAAGAWHLLAWFNWEDQPTSWSFRPENFRLPTRNYLAHSFWDGECFALTAGSEHIFHRVEKHGCVLLALRVDHGGPLYLGSDLHISQGLEVSAWQEDGHSLTVQFDLPRRAQGTARFHLPGSLPKSVLDGLEIPATKLGGDIYAFPVQFNHRAVLTIEGVSKP